MKAELKALIERWDTFLGKLSARVDEVLAEADAGFDQLIAINVTDPAPLSGAVSAFEARMHGLERKIEDAWDKLDEQLRSGSALRVRDELRAKADALHHRVELARTEMSVRKRAKAARALAELAREEMQRPVSCSHCGGPLTPEVRHVASNVNCPACDAVNAIQPGTAAGSYYQGGALHALAEEAALPQWQLMKQEEQRYNDLRRPGGEDLERLRQATESYWRRYWETYGELHPDWSREQVEAELRGKMGHFRSFHEGLR